MLLVTLALGSPPNPTPASPPGPTVAPGERIELVDDGTLVEQVTWARPFRLQKEHPYRYARPARDITEGWLVELRVAAWTQRAGPVVPNLWIGSTIAGRLRWNSACAVVWVPGAHDLATEPVFFGTTTLPEQIDAARAESIVTLGRVLPQPPRHDVRGAAIQVEDFRALARVASERCSGEPPR